jgi:hypothetical protein
MDGELLARARARLEARQPGDLSALEPLLDPDEELLWWKAGNWICANPQWASFVADELLLWALVHGDFGDDVLEIGPGSFASTAACVSVI